MSVLFIAILLLYICLELINFKVTPMYGWFGRFIWVLAFLFLAIGLKLYEAALVFVIIAFISYHFAREWRVNLLNIKGNATNK